MTRSTSGARAAFLGALLVALCLAPQAMAQRGRDKGCPWCKDDPKVLEAAGLVGHGKMPFGKNDSEEIKAFLSYTDPIFLESAHFRVASTLEEFTIPERQWKQYAAELEGLRRKLPTMPKRLKTLDPWLRLHLYAERCEQRFARFLEIIDRKESDFPPKRIFGQKYMGEGAYLGMKEKFEVFLHKDIRAFTDYLREHSGSTVKKTKREHYVSRGALGVVIPAMGDLRDDENLHAHLSHNLGHNFLLGYKHYSYEPPLWIEEGFAHVFEKEVSPEYNSFDSEEAAIGEMYQGSNWYEGVLKALDRGKAASLADLMHKKGFSDLGKEDHLIAWSKVEFLMSQHPKAWAKLLDVLRGRVDDQGYTDGGNLLDVQRDFFRDEFSWSFADFDREWEKWVRKAYLGKQVR